MRCSKCNAANQPAAKFCIECGAAFPLSCVKCGFKNPSGAKFCQDCGAALKASAFPLTILSEGSASDEITVTEQDLSGELSGGERKTVTALFADIKGSMELTENLDPEEARDS
jgi:ribosomal protein L40E